MQDAEACFMIAARNYTDKTAAVSNSFNVCYYQYYIHIELINYFINF